MQIPALPATLASRADARADAAARAPIDVDAVATAVAPTAVAPATAAPVVRVAAPSRGGLSAWDPQLHGQLADAQQALSFLDQAAAQLQGLKADVSGRLAGRAVSDAQVGSKLRQFAATWSRRAQDAGASLSPSLDYEQPATQRFTVRGLNLASLRGGERETLAFAAGAGRAPMTVQLEPELADDEIVRRFARALAPADIGVAAGADGALVFSSPESEWPAVRDALAVRGGGIRFAAGQAVRVRADAEPAAVQPESWQAGDAGQLRRTLQQIVQALERVHMARENVSHALATMSAGVHGPPKVADPVGATTFVDAFVAAIGQPGFASFSPVTAALSGISRDRVLSLLALGLG
jgi:hypothetical protein